MELTPLKERLKIRTLDLKASIHKKLNIQGLLRF